MSQCTQRYLALCSKPKPLLKDGWAGINAKIFLPFVGFVFGSGATVVFPGSTVPQDYSPLLAGATKANTFQKNE